jgi:hypothetical protein
LPTNAFRLSMPASPPMENNGSTEVASCRSSASLDWRGNQGAYCRY